MAVELMGGKLPARPEVGFTDSLWTTLESCWKVECKGRPSIDAVLRRLNEALRAGPFDRMMLLMVSDRCESFGRGTGSR